MDCIQDVINSEGKYIQVYIGKETVTDVREGSVTITYPSPPDSIKGILEDLTPASAVYKMPGKNVQKGKIFVCHKNYRSTFEASHKIIIDDETYYGWRDGAGSNLTIKGEGNYIRVYLMGKLYA